MKNNILGGLVIFVIVLTCLLMLDDITNPQNQTVDYQTVEVENTNQEKDLAVIESNEEE